MKCRIPQQTATLLLAVAAAVLLQGCNNSSENSKVTPESKGPTTAAPREIELLNVSYDPTRELWRQINDKFIPIYEKESGNKLSIKQSHGGSGTQARLVVDGLEADVVTLALWSDVDAIRRAGLIADNWQKQFPDNSYPYYSTIVFVVRKGNPKGIKDWSDLVRSEVQIVTPNPKTSGNGKLSFLAAWGSVTTRGGSEKEAEEFVTKLYRQTPVLDSGARAATTTFAQKGIGDVHLTWENEARLEVAEADGALEVVYPPLSIRAEPPVAVVDANVKRKDTLDVAKAYLNFLYTDAGQEIIASNYYRPQTAAVLERHKESFPAIKLFTIQEVAKDWDTANKRFFSEGGVFDGIYNSAK
jgi:sulfate/thiosulfate-binding protein